MYIRFFSGWIDEDAHVCAGLFNAAFELQCSCHLPDYELEVLNELFDWFDVHLRSPIKYLPRAGRYRRYQRAICWFKASAREHLARAWELVTVLERNDVLIWTIKSGRPGYIHYEDEAQVFAEPYHDVRLLL